MSNANDFPTQVPNKGISNPKVREGLNAALGVASGLLAVVVAVDLSSNAFDLSEWTNPIGAGLLAAGAAFGLAVTGRNYPKF